MSGLPPHWERQEIRAARGPKEPVDPTRAIAQWDELEIAYPNGVVPTRVLLLAGSECRFTCTMCDLWRHTLNRATSPGDLTVQIQHGLSEPWDLSKNDPSITPVLNQRWIKLYNSSNFFDPYNVPTQDLKPIAELLTSFSRVIVENHPRLLPATIPTFRDQLSGRLEVAMGLETTNPHMLRWLNKGMVLDDFKKAMDELNAWQIDTRVFLLLGLPGKSYTESLDLCLKSVELASGLGVRHCSVIPTRTQHGVLAQLKDQQVVPKITASNLEETLSLLLGKTSSIVTVDLWDWDKLPGHCAACRHPRKKRLQAMCVQQTVLPATPIFCNCRRDLTSALVTESN